MATHARLRVILPSGDTLKPIYVHYDGYPKYMLYMLNTYYKTPEKAIELVNLGNLSYVDKKVKPDENEKHTFNNPAPDVTVAYHRDRSETLSFNHTRQEFNYVFNGTKWKLE